MLGWDTQAQITYHKQIKMYLHPIVWDLTRNLVLLNSDNKNVVKPDLTIVKWQESHFRARLRQRRCSPTLSVCAACG